MKSSDSNNSFCESSSSPPEPTPAATARTGIAVLDRCVQDYRLAERIVSELKAGRSKIRSNLEALLQVRSLLVGNPINGPARDALTAALERFGFTAETVDLEMAYAMQRHAALRTYVNAGQHCYEVSPGLAERLRATELHGVTGDMVRLPFESIAVVVPDELEDVAEVIFLTIRPANSVTNVRTDELIMDPVLSMVAYGRDGTDINTFTVSPRLNGGDIRDALAECLRNYENDDRSTTLDAVRERVRRLFWWVLNVCLYITHAGAELEPKHPDADAERSWWVINAESGAKRRQRLLNLYNAKFRQRIYLGRTVQPLGLGTRGPISVQTLVAGHWRNQPWGKGRLERRLTWIEPFWRGPRDAPMSNPIRVATEPAISRKAG